MCPELPDHFSSDSPALSIQPDIVVSDNASSTGNISDLQRLERLYRQVNEKYFPEESLNKDPARIQIGLTPEQIKEYGEPREGWQMVVPPTGDVVIVNPDALGESDDYLEWILGHESIHVNDARAGLFKSLGTENHLDSEYRAYSWNLKVKRDFKLTDDQRNDVVIQRGEVL